MRLIGLLSVVMFLANPVWAISPDSAALIKASIQYVCTDGLGSYETTDPVEPDLDGDGQPDLIFGLDHIKCQNQRAGHGCGVHVCSFQIYLRRGGVLHKQMDRSGLIERVAPGVRPVVTIKSHGFHTGLLQWDGLKFNINWID